MSCACEEAVVLTESEKIFSAGMVPLNIRDRLCRVITDAAIPEQALEALTAQGIEVIT